MSLSKSISGFDPRSIPGCALWLDAADASTFTLSGSSVTQWRDKSGNGNNMSNVGTGITSGTNINGVASVAFSSGSYLATTSNVSVNTLNQTFFVVSKFTSNIYPADANYQNNTYLRQATSQTGEFYYLFARNNASPYRWGLENSLVNYGPAPASSTINTTAAGPTNAVFIACIQRSGASSGLVNYNGSSISVSFATSQPSVASDVLNVGVNMNGSQIGELLFYNDAVTISQIQQIEGYLAWKWGLQAGIPTLMSPVSVPGCALWLDAADDSTFTFSSGTSIATWKDKSPNAFVGSAVSSPILTQNSINGRPSVVLNGSSQFINFGNVLNVGTSPLSVFSVCKFDGSSEGSIIGKTSFRGLGGRWYIGRANTVGRSGTMIDTGGGGIYAEFVDTSTSTQILSSYWDRSTLFMFQNGTQRASTSASSSANLSTTDLLLVGAYPNNVGGLPPQSGYYFFGKICEIIVYLGTVSTFQRQQIEGYLATKWGLASSLVSGHPYNTSTALTVSHPYRSLRPFSRIFQPTDIPACALWLDAADASTFTPSNPSSGTAITQWNDKSGNGLNVVKNASISAPTYSPTGLNSRPTLSFTTNQMLQTPSINPQTTLTSNTTDSTIFAVCIITGDNSQYGGLFGLSTTTNNYILRVPWANADKIWDCGSRLTYNAITNGTYIISLVRSGSNMFMYMNGVLVASLTNASGSVTSVSQSLEIGRGDTVFARSPISEFVIFNRGINGVERQQIEGYLAWKWGILSSIPTVHPYNRLPPSSVTFNPLSISGMALWLDAADQTSYSLSGSTLSSITDKSGSGKTVTVNSAPTFSGTAFNNRPGFVFASGNRLSTTTVALGQNMTLIAVHRVTVNATAVPLAIGSTNSGNETGIGFNSGGALYNIYDYGIGENGNNTISTSGVNLIHIGVKSSSAPNLLCVLNGTTSGSATSTYSNANTQINIGGGGFAFVGVLAEVIVFSVAITPSQRQQIEGYLAWKWGLTASLPSSHPYKKFSP